MNRITAVAQELETLTYRPRRYLAFTPTGKTDVLTSVVAAGPVAGSFRLSETDLFFEKAYFYGGRGLSIPALPPIANAQAVLIAEQAPNLVFLHVDVVPNDPTTPVLFQATMGTKLNFRDFIVTIQAAGDVLTIKYQ